MAAVSLKQLLADYPEDTRKLVSQLSDILLELFPEMQVMPDNGPPAVIGFGYGTGYKDTLFTMILSQKGLKLGITNGSSLPDPKNLLEGSGKVHKYVVINKSRIASEDLNDLLMNAHHAYLEKM